MIKLLKWISFVNWELLCSDAKFQIFYTVDNPSKDWYGGSGYITKDMVVKGLPGPSDDALILVSFSVTFHLTSSKYGI